MPGIYHGLGPLLGLLFLMGPAAAQEPVVEKVIPEGRVVSALEGGTAGDITYLERNTENRPAINMASTSHDFGRVLPGGLLSHDFVFTNSGQSDLIIREVHPGCGCTVANFDKVVKPGENGRVSIVVTVYPSWAGSTFKRQAMVVTNDPNRANVILTFSGQVLKEGETL